MVTEERKKDIYLTAQKLQRSFITIKIPDELKTRCPVFKETDAVMTFPLMRCIETKPEKPNSMDDITLHFSAFPELLTIAKGIKHFEYLLPAYFAAGGRKDKRGTAINSYLVERILQMKRNPKLSNRININAEFYQKIGEKVPATEKGERLIRERAEAVLS